MDEPALRQAVIEKALWLAGEVESLCEQYWIARQAGRPRLLGDAEMDRVLERFRTYGKPSPPEGR